MAATSLTKEMLETSLAEQSFHGNMGFDDRGRHKGYAYGYRLIKYPRVEFVNRQHLLPSKKFVRTYYVDGAEVEGIDGVIAALAKPPVLTPEETEALAKLSDEFEDMEVVEERLLGAPRAPGAVMPGTKEAKGFMLIHGLMSKGMIEMGSRPLPAGHKLRSARLDFLPDSMRQIPTVRRRPQGGDNVRPIKDIRGDRSEQRGPGEPGGS